MGIVERSVDIKPVVWPVETLTKTDRSSENVHRLVGIVGVFHERLPIPTIVAVASITTIAVSAVTAIAAVSAIVAWIVAHALRTVVIVASIDSGLHGVEERCRKEVRTLATKPWIGELYTKRVIVATITHRIKSEGLPIALRDETTIRFRVEEVVDREVGKVDTGTPDDTRLRPTEGELKLVIVSALQRVLYVHSTLLGVRDWRGKALFWIKVPELVERHPGVHHILLAKELTRLRIELTTNHLLVDVMVASYDHLVDGSLRTLHNAQVE